MPTPVGAVIWILKFTFAGWMNDVAENVMMMVGRGTGITDTPVDTLTELPAVSVSVAVTVYGPGFLNTCDTTALPVTAPRSCVEPSPQFTKTSRTALPLAAAAVTTNVNDAGNPALGGV